MNAMVVPSCVQVPVCSVLPLHLSGGGVFQGSPPFVPSDFRWLLNFPIFRAPTFSAFSSFDF